MMETRPSASDPDTLISIRLFNDVTNVSELKQAARENRIAASLISPSLIASPLQLWAAANRAVYLHKHGKLATKTVHSEVLYCLSASKNISDAFRKFGVSDNSGAVVVVEIHKAGASHMDEIAGQVKGEGLALDKLGQFSEEADVRKAYKVKEPELVIGTLEEAILGRIATKDFVPY